ncbi:hypothetical protein [Jeongeupia sp. USM3]|uniref:hypothetical protein n=1 Tax=Jeongeupia sp. USM3 TaxID=1906741 RepID=UPI00143BB653|nr:hypothetical protein [Jeongeupia sp. USM3]
MTQQFENVFSSHVNTGYTLDAPEATFIVVHQRLQTSKYAAFPRMNGAGSR